MNSEFIFTDVLNRAKKALRIKTDTAIAKRLGMSKSTYCERKERGSIPYEQLFQLMRSEGVDINWVMTGLGEPQLVPLAISDPTPIYSVSNKALKVAELFDHLTESQQREILSAVEEKERLNEILERLRRLEASGDQQQQCA
jgi:transcriptional regulator with XRE-family HTH domain